jgi:iron complex transport system substrate-binding protein
MRICSLLPGATEIVAALGLSDSLVGISHECDYPPSVKAIPVMVQSVIESHHATSEQIDRQVQEVLSTGQQLYQLREAAFLDSHPDLVISQGLCDVCAITPHDLQQAMQSFPQQPLLLTLNPTTLDEVITDVERIAEAAQCQSDGRRLTSELQSRLTALREMGGKQTDRPRVACIEWLSPLYAGGHWVPDMVAAAGGIDCLGTSGTPSREVSWEELDQAKPDLIVLMPCGFSIDQTRRELGTVTTQPSWHKLRAVRNRQVFLVEASSYFSRPGPRLVDGVALLAAAFHQAAYDTRLPAGICRLDT